MLLWATAYGPDWSAVNTSFEVLGALFGVVTAGLLLVISRAYTLYK